MTRSEEFAGIGPELLSPTLSRYRSVRITLPDGRHIPGRRPGDSGVSCAEHLLRDELARQIRGITEAQLEFGRADILTADAVFEVESAAKWRHGARQALAYSAECGLPPSLALFGQADREQVRRVLIKLTNCTPQIALWWHTGHSWNRLTARKQCRDMPPLDAVIERLKGAARRAS